MSNRTATATKAVAAAWANEKELVAMGKGTRDWTKEQQEDILNKGRAYDDNGIAFEGHHMKSVEKFPKYQGRSDDIQFLSKKEHIAAHSGNWQNYTNGYYNYVDGTTKKFKQNELIPCEIIELSNPIYDFSKTIKETNVKQTNKQSSTKNINSKESNINTTKTVSNRLSGQKAKEVIKNAAKNAATVAKNATAYAKDHPVEIIGLAIDIGVDVLTSKTGTGSSKNAMIKVPLPQAKSATPSATRASPKAHIVPAGGQHYHTKNGVVWRDKPAYPRGGK